MDDGSSHNKVDVAANLTIAWLSNPNVRANDDDATNFLTKIHSTLVSLSGEGGSTANDMPASGAPTGADDRPEPAVTVRKSLASRDRIISLIDGKPYTSLKRHLGRHGLTPAQYRERYGLKPDYPMVAPAYAEKRRELAKKIGLGRKPASGGPGAAARSANAKPTPAKRASAKAAAPKPRGRPAKSAAPTA